MLTVEEITNVPVPSVCYVVHDPELSNRCLIIDPGSSDSSHLFALLEKHQLVPEMIVLTHEHFDHCCGVNDLRNKYPEVSLVVSELCAVRLGNPKKNFSYYYDPQNPLSVEGPYTIANESLTWQRYLVEFISTPGHTASSMSVKIDNALFMGDAYLPGFKTVTNLPTGNKTQCAESERLLLTLIEKGGLTVYPGHREEGTLYIK